MKHMIPIGVLVLALAAAFRPGSPRITAASDGNAHGAQHASRSDAIVENFQHELLHLAFEAASAIPVEPHIKSRSRAQAAIIEAWLQLDQPQQALRALERIDDWRRGAAHAQVALHAAQNHDAASARSHLAKAHAIADRTSDWRRDRIRALIAQAHARLGEDEAAMRIAANLDTPEAATVERALAMQLQGQAEFDARLRHLRALAATRDFELMKHALEAGTDMIDRAYNEADRRDAVEQMIRESWSALPLMIRIDRLMALASVSIKHDDHAKGRELLRELRQILGQHEWTPEYHIAAMARQAALRHRAGETPEARGDVDWAIAHFDKYRELIVNIDRAGVLREVAQAHQKLGDLPAALAMYARAIETGVENPNSRPRAEDLAATCASMALHKVEPGAELWVRLRQIREELSDPW